MSLTYIIHAFSIGIFGIFSVRDRRGNFFAASLQKRLERKARAEGNGLILLIILSDLE